MSYIKRSGKNNNEFIIELTKNDKSQELIVKLRL